MNKQTITCAHCKHHQAMLTFEELKGQFQTELDYVGTKREHNWFTAIDASPMLSFSQHGWRGNHQNTRKRFYCSPSCWVMAANGNIPRKSAKRIITQWLEQHVMNPNLLHVEKVRVDGILYPKK